MVVVWSSRCHLLSDVHELAHTYLQAQKIRMAPLEKVEEKRAAPWQEVKKMLCKVWDLVMSDLALALQSPPSS